MERGYLEKIPIYTDYITPQKEKELRTYLLDHHLKAIEARQARPINNEREIQDRLKQKELSAIGEEFEELCFFYNVPKKYRYLSPHAKKVLWNLGQRFQKLLREKGLYDKVRFAVSSTLRPREYQKELGSRNANAAIVSSHSYGESFDIFFDEFYVALEYLNEPEAATKEAKTIFEQKLRRRLGFLMGQSLRRQFRSVLTEAILELQTEGQLYAILEKKQRCYHITAR